MLYYFGSVAIANSMSQFVVFGEKLALMNRLCGIKPIMCVGAIGHSFLPKVKLCAAKSWP